MRPRTLVSFSALLLCLLGAFGRTNGSTISGQVSGADGKPLSGVFVCARNAATGQTTYVMTRAGGRFVIPLPQAGHYEVRVDDRAWNGAAQRIDLSETGPGKANLVVTRNPVKLSALTSAELLPLLPDGEGKQVLLANCMSCHTLQKFVTGSWNRDGWRKIVGNMTKGFGATVPEGKETELIDYLASAFGPEAGMSQWIKKMPLHSAVPMDVVYSSWDIPIQRAMPHTVTLDHAGNAWFTDAFGSHIGRLELAGGKFKVWSTPTPNSIPHGVVIDKNGKVWFTERLQFEPANKIVGFDPQTEKFTEYPLPRNVSGPHTPVLDSQGILWVSEYDGNRISRFDPQTGKFIEYEVPTKNARPYGIDVDRNGIIWIAEIGSGSLGKLDPKTGKVVDYPTPTKDSGVRRVRIDSKGRVWFTEFLGDRLGMFDPKTEKMTEYLMPGVRPQPYAVEITHDDKIWLSTWHQDVMMRFDPDTKKFAIYPVPFLDMEVRDFRIDKDDTLWFLAMIPKKVVSMKAR